jgi:hypothetical protein
MTPWDAQGAVPFAEDPSKQFEILKKKIIFLQIPVMLNNVIDLRIK